MHLGVFLYQLNPQYGGAFTVQETILQGLLRLKPNHDITVFSYGDVSSYTPQDRLKFVQVHKLLPDQSWAARGQRVIETARSIVNRSYLDKKPGELHAAAVANKIDLMWFPTQAFEHVEVPYIFTVWDLQHRLQPYFPEVTVTGCTYEQREVLFQDACPRASYVVTSNPTARDEVNLFYSVPKERIKMLPQPTSDFVFQIQTEAADLHLIPNEPYLFYPAQFWPHKNHVVILEALAILKRDHQQNFKVVFTGSDKGNIPYIESYAKRLGVFDQLSFLNFVSTPTMVELYKRAFALVYPSFFGPENMPPLEAFALGCPVIASSVAGSEHQMGDAALRFDPRSEKELVSAILRLRAEPDLRSRLTKLGRERALAWKSDDYINGIFQIVDDFAGIRRCWSSDVPYIHT